MTKRNDLCLRCDLDDVERLGHVIDLALEHCNRQGMAGKRLASTVLGEGVGVYNKHYIFIDMKFEEKKNGRASSRSKTRRS